VNLLRIGSLSLLLCCFLCGGCSTSQPESAATPLNKEALFRLYQRQQYSECLESISKAQNPRLPRKSQAELLLLEAICREEMGQTDEANLLYRTIIQKFGHTEPAERASHRLLKAESDQTEHFTIDFAPGKWQRLDKQWNSLNLRERYISATDSRDSVIILAKDLGPERGSISSALTQVRSIMRADVEHLDFKNLDESADQALFEFSARNSSDIKRESVEGEVQYGMKMRHSTGVGRVLLTNRRMHVLIFSTTAFFVSDEQKRKWLTALKQARLASGSQHLPSVP
jgi:hypothetical protein